MKMLYFTCNVSMESRLLETLEKQGVRDFQLYNEVTAKSVKGEPRFNTSVWPGYNSTVFVQVRDDDKVRKVMEAIRKMNGNALNDSELITACSWTLDNYIFD